MKIEGNQKELDAMVEFHKGNRVEGLRLQEEFAAEFRKEYKDKDHCPCLKSCRYHGNCKECVAIHSTEEIDHHIRICIRQRLIRCAKDPQNWTGKDETKEHQHNRAAAQHGKGGVHDLTGFLAVSFPPCD